MPDERRDVSFFHTRPFFVAVAMAIGAVVGIGIGMGHPWFLTPGILVYYVLLWRAEIADMAHGEHWER